MMKKCLRECKNGVSRIDTWDALNLEDAIISLEEGLLPQPSASTLTNIIRQYDHDKNKTDYALRLHAYMLQSGLEAHASIGDYLVSLLVDVGSICRAHCVFDKLKSKSEYSWNALVNGYLKCGEFRHAFTLHQIMQENCIDSSGHTYVALLKACAKLKDGERGSHLHAEIAKRGLLRSNRFVGTALVDMYAKCGMLIQARDVFDMLSTQDIVLWNALIAGYAQQDCGEDALEFLEQMQRHGFSPNAVTLACSLKACGSIGAIDKGRELHTEIARTGLQKTNQFIGNALVDMYAKCGLLVKAQEAFDMLPVQNIVSWNALISAYVQHKCGRVALDCFAQMQLKGVSPDEVTITCVLKACGSIGAVDKGIQIHSDVAKSGLSKNLLVGNALVDFYAKCDLLGKARKVFDKLPARDVVSWTTLITGYAQHEHGDEALDCFEQMQLNGVTPDTNAYISCLKACGSIGAISEGRDIHADIERKGLLNASPAVGNALIEMYATCGLFSKAHEVLDVLSVRNIVAWTALIAGYVQHEHGEEALQCFEQMRLDGVSPDAVTLAYGLKACGSIGAVQKGGELHAYIERKGFLESSVVGTALLDMYAKCGLLKKAQEVFYKLPKCDVVAWNALIAGYVQHEHFEEALILYKRMQIQCVSPNDVTFACTLKACCSIRSLEKGREIHAEIARKGIWITHQLVGNALIDLYAKCGSLVLAREVFEMLPSKDTISWNALIAGYVQHDCGEIALECFEKMKLKGVPQDAATLTCGLKACGSIGDVGKGQGIHADIERNLLLENVVVGTAVVDMYAKCGLLVKAQEIFNKLRVHDVIAWTTLISGYAQHEQSEEALNCLEQMQRDGVSPNASTYASSLKACGNSGNIEKGSEIHAKVEQIGLLKSSQIVGNAVIDMYAKCGMLPKSQQVFNKLPVRDLFSWNILITGYAQRGETENVFHMFEKMREEGLKPDAVTFTSLLNACSHAGLIEKGQTYFESMCQNHGIIPTLEHDTCMVDLFGRAGQLERALEVMKTSLFHPHIEMWLTVLSACRKWENVDLGRQAFEHTMRLDEKEVAAYVCMYNIYADAGMHEDARKVEEMSERKTGKKLRY